MFKAVFCTPGNEDLLKEFTERILKTKFKNFKIISQNLPKIIFMKKGNI